MTPPLHALLAEDEDLVAMVLSEALRDDGFRVTVTYNGLEALQADEKDPADILLTDMRMPVMDGNSLIELIRQRRPDLPIVVMTGYSASVPKEQPGRLVVVRKPYLLGTVIGVANTLLQAR